MRKPLLLRDHPLAPRSQTRWYSACTVGSPLLLSGLWSDLASLLSRWEAAPGSGVGLVLQLFSCFTGDESAMELWLLLSSAEAQRPAVVQTCRGTDHLPQTVSHHSPCMSIIPGDELFSGVVSSEPYFSSLPFFLFLFFFRDRKKETHC